MKVDGGPGAKAPLDAIGAVCAAAERDGYDGVFVPETIHDPFVVLTLAAQATQHVELGTKVAIAFARSPMALAYTANDLQHLSAGRLVLGLGTQVRPHILRRFSMPWSRPAARMREYVLALRAIWDAWNDEKPLDFKGEFFTHTLMNPLFCPPPNRYGRPQVMMAGVGPHMIEAAGEVADRFACHSFISPAYLADVVKPPATVVTVLVVMVSVSPLLAPTWKTCAPALAPMMATPLNLVCAARRVISADRA